MPNSIQTLDENILFYIQLHLKSPALDKLMVLFTELGNGGLIWIGIAIALLLWKRSQKCGVCLTFALTLSNLFGDSLLKPFFHRIRPCNQFSDVVLLIHAPHSYSFPSGHTMVGFACATVIIYYHRKLGIAAFLLATMIAFSRMYLFVHYPTDILGGILLGVTGSCLLICVMNPLLRKLYEAPSSPFKS